jgi:hypothetical protein
MKKHALIVALIGIQLVTYHSRGATISGRVYDLATPSRGIPGIEVHIKPDNGSDQESLTDDDGDYEIEITAPIGTKVHLRVYGVSYGTALADLVVDRNDVKKDVYLFKSKSDQSNYWQQLVEGIKVVEVEKSLKQGTAVSKGVVSDVPSLWESADSLGINPVAKSYLSQAIISEAPAASRTLPGVEEYAKADPEEIKTLSAQVRAKLDRNGDIPSKNEVLTYLPANSVPSDWVVSDVFAYQLRTKSKGDQRIQLDKLNREWSPNIASKCEQFLMGSDGEQYRQ